jgi:hypothetical protein
VQRGGRYLWLRSLDSLEERPLPQAPDTAGRFFWSRDSRYLVFGALGQLRKVDVQGGPPLVLSDHVSAVAGGFTTSDGRVVFSTAFGLRQVPSAGGAAELILKSDDLRISEVSPLPDGAHFLYMKQTTDAPGIYVGALSAGSLRESK